MQPAAFGHQIQTLHEGLTVFQEGAGRLIPMQSTEIAIEIKAGVAIIRTQRVFRNEEDVAIEAVLTMPVGFDTVVTGLSATVDDRKLIAIAKTQSAARDDYEGAIDEGKMAILHEEVLKGVHTLSIAQLAPGKEVMVDLETVTSMSCIAGEPFLRIPTTEVNNVPIRLAALDCPERGTRDGDYASMIAKQFQGLQATCELTGAKTYDRLVGYCKITGADFGEYMMQNSACKVWEKYDVWNRY